MAKATVKAKIKARPKSSTRSVNRSRPSKTPRPVYRKGQSTGAAEAEFRCQPPIARRTFQGGLRRYAKYRDLGMAEATGGMVQAHVIRFVPPCRPEEVSKLHYHDVDFQMVYVLQGWIKTEFDGAGCHRDADTEAPGSSRRASSTRCSIIRTIARCSRSCCRRTSRPWSSTRPSAARTITRPLYFAALPPAAAAPPCAL